MTSTRSAKPASRMVGLPAIAAAALCVFLVVMTLLAWNLRMGHDPALATYAAPAQHAVAPVKGHAVQVSAPVTKSSGGG